MHVRPTWTKLLAYEGQVLSISALEYSSRSMIRLSSLREYGHSVPSKGKRRTADRSGDLLVWMWNPAEVKRVMEIVCSIQT